ncbi:hypothetical protein [Aliarcobacter butzleri]|uniref:hypothetical protein n=1 Tax=Aliarcobacter butzleri TaxID=28197 RepID=UPI00214AA639|nr:hypothetical protein [Aliarcobacter butzleri]MCP3649963.1 hypothetical protein [Arcobacter sp. DNRA7]MCR1816136.1 hypothetical protein [Aliarcobacter butzleri]
MGMCKECTEVFPSDIMKDGYCPECLNKGLQKEELKKIKDLKIIRSIETPIREFPSFEERWRGEDNGLITAWEVGREKAISNPQLKQFVLNGELPVLGYVGGYEKKLTNIKFKYASFYYLAQLQGLRGDNLDIDSNRDEGKFLICSKTNMKTIFTSNSENFNQSN